MLNLALNRTGADPLTILCLGSHSDDVEIGCGGTLLKLIESDRRVNLRWIVFSASEQRAVEARASAMKFSTGAADIQIEVKAFRDGFFPYLGSDIKEFFEDLKRRCDPDLIFTHYRDDRHQDHRLVSDLTWNTFRDHTILEYEIPKYDGDLGRPSVFVPLDADTAEKKARLITTLFRSQSGKSWMSEETFRSLMHLRGVECAAPSGYAEAFHARKVVIG